MKNKWLRITFGALAMIALAAFLVSRFTDMPGAAAQDISEPWSSSDATLPEGTSVDALSPPDQTDLDPNRTDAELEPRAAIRSQRISGSVLRPRESTVDFNWAAGGGCIYANSDPFTVWNTPIWLPQGAEVIRLRMYYNDTSGSNSVAWFSIYDAYGELVDEWDIGSSGDSGLGFNDSDPISHEIDYSTYSYVLNWRPVVTGSTMQLCGFRIFFDPPPFYAQFLPSVSKD